MFAPSLSRCHWPLGLVSNCWKTQLDAGIDLDSLIAQAERCGLSVVELRQTCLGTYEIGPDYAPDAVLLAGLASQFPNVQFNIALSLPCLGGGLSVDNSMFITGINAAVALAGTRVPHLRLVDLQTPSGQFTADTVDRVAQGIAKLMPAILDVGGILSIEHARQPWNWFRSAFSEARLRLGKNAEHLQLCFDPCNLLLTEPIEQVSEIVGSVELSTLSMIHVKQRRDGLIQPDLAEGDLDWPLLIGLLTSRGYQGPILFEIAPHSNVWSHLNSAINQF